MLGLKLNHVSKRGQWWFSTGDSQTQWWKGSGSGCGQGWHLRDYFICASAKLYAALCRLYQHNSYNSGIHNILAVHIARLSKNSVQSVWVICSIRKCANEIPDHSLSASGCVSMLVLVHCSLSWDPNKTTWPLTQIYREELSQQQTKIAVDDEKHSTASKLGKYCFTCVSSPSNMHTPVISTNMHPLRYVSFYKYGNDVYRYGRAPGACLWLGNISKHLQPLFHEIMRLT